MEEALIAHSEEHIQENEKVKLKPLTGFQIKVMLVLCFVNFCSCTGFTLLTTFFPYESMTARKITNTQNSLIFAVYALINIVACPVFGYYLPTIGVRKMLLSGILLSGVGALLFGCICWEYDPLRFTILACTVRVIQAFACAMYLTAAYSIMTHVWSERRTQAVGLLEMTTGAGMVIGPMLGSALYNWAGFMLPFQCLAGFLFLGSIPTALVLRDLDMKAGTNPKNSITNSIMLSSRLYSGDFTEQLTFRQFCSIFTSPGTYATILLTVLCWSAMDFVLPGFQNHVFRIYPTKDTASITTTTGALFVVYAVAYSIGTPIVGKLCTVWGHKSARPCMLIGALLIVISYLFMGPQEQLAEWTGLAKLGVQNYMGGAVHIGIIFVLLGVGLALVSVPSVEDLVQCCYKVGLPKEGIATVAVVSGFYNCILFVGEFVGPMVQGVIADWLKTDKSMTPLQQISQMYFWWAVVCAGITVTAAVIYGCEEMYDRYASSKSPKRAHIGEASILLEQDRKNRLNSSAVFGPQSFSMSISTRNVRSRRRISVSQSINRVAE